MANTIIQIKRSSSTATPAGGSLSAAELAYSYNSDKLFLGSANGLDVIAIGGKFFTDLGLYSADVSNASFTRTNAAYTTANAAFNAANNAVTDYSPAFNQANAAFTRVNSAFTEANSASTVAAAAFGQANSAYGVANSALQTSGGTVSGDLAVSGNLTISGTTTYANTQVLNIGDSIFTLNADLPGGSAPSENAGMEVNRGSATDVSLLWNEAQTAWTFTNDGTNYFKIASNTSVENVATGANAYADLVGTAANANAAVAYSSAVSAGEANAAAAFASALGYANTVGGAANTFASSVGTSANAFASSVGSSANAYADLVGGAANTNASNGSYISSGIVRVPYGGTGVTSFTTNGILYGNNSGDLKVTGAGTEGQVLQASAAGVPSFGMLDGGTF